MKEGIINIAFVLSVILVLLSAVDLLISKQVKIWIEDKFETFTLKVDELAPVRVMMLFKHIEGKLACLIFGSGQILLIDLVLKECLNLSITPGISPSTHLLLILYLPLIVVTFFIISIKTTRDADRQLAQNKLKAYLIYAIIFLLPPCAYIIEANIAYYIYDLNISSIYESILSEDLEPHVTLSILISALVSIIFVYPLIMLLGFMFFLFMSCLVLLLSFILKPLKVIAWKVSDYNGGILQGIAIVSAAVVGFIKLFVE